MTSAAHERYQRQLTTLASDRAILGAMEEAVGSGAWWPSRKKWTRMFERFHPGQDPFATLVFGTEDTPQLIRHLEVFHAPPTDRSEDALLVFHEPVGWIRVTHFPSDNSLSTLSSVLAGSGERVVVQYWPRRRCTIRCEEQGRTRFAKIYPKKYLRRDRGQQLHEAAVALRDAASRGELGFAVAHPLRWDSEARAHWQELLEGAPGITQLLGLDGPNVARSMGQAAASLTRCSVTPPRVFDRAEQLADSIAYGEELRWRVPRLAALVDALLETLLRMDAALARGPLRPIHGDLHPSQWINDGKRLGLLDFDDFSLGDPERDAAFFLVQLESEYSPQAPVRRLAEAFLSGYERVAGHMDRQLLATYMSHKWLSKALKAARELRPNGDALSERCLQRARGIPGCAKDSGDQADTVSELWQLR